MQEKREIQRTITTEKICCKEQWKWLKNEWPEQLTSFRVMEGLKPWKPSCNMWFCSIWDVAHSSLFLWAHGWQSGQTGMRHEGANKSRKEATGAAMGGDDIGGRGGITQGISFEFFESFFINLLTQYPLGKFRVFFQKLLTTLIKTYSQGNFRNWSKKALYLAQQVILSKNPKVLSWICSKFAHNVPNHLLNGFFESLLKDWTKLRVFFE